MAGDFFVGSGRSGVPALALPRRVKGVTSTRLPAFGRCHILWQISSADAFAEPSRRLRRRATTRRPPCITILTGLGLPNSTKTLEVQRFVAVIYFYSCRESAASWMHCHSIALLTSPNFGSVAICFQGLLCISTQTALLCRHRVARPAGLIGIQERYPSLRIYTQCNRRYPK